MYVCMYVCIYGYDLYCFACMSIRRSGGGGGDRLVQLKDCRHAAVLVL